MAAQTKITQLDLTSKIQTTLNALKIVEPLATADVPKAKDKLMATDFSTVVGFTSTTTLLSETAIIDATCAAEA